MARTTMEEQKDLLVFPDDSLLLLKVLEANIQTVEGKNGRQDWEKLSFKFKILQIMYCGDGGPIERFNEMVGKEIYGSVSWYLTNSPENKLRQWAEALLQVQMDLGFELDTNMFPGRTVKGVTSTYEGRSTDPVTGQKRRRHQIESLISADGVPTLGASGMMPAQGGWGQPPAGWQPPAQQQAQQQAPQQNGVAQNGWATPGVQQQPVQQQPQQQQPVATQPNWAPQQNLMQQDQQVQPQPPQPQQQAQQPTQQGFAQQQYQQYQQPQGQPQQPPQPTQVDPAQAAQGQDPWALAQDPNEPGF